MKGLSTSTMKEIMSKNKYLMCKISAFFIITPIYMKCYSKIYRIGKVRDCSTTFAATLYEQCVL